jgi:hypothetical protein
VVRGALQVSRERHAYREDVLCRGYFSPRASLTVRSRSREMSYALNARTAVLSEFGRLRRRDACSRAKRCDVCDAGADDHLCRTRTHSNIFDAACHDGNQLALGRMVAPARSDIGGGHRRGAGLAKVKGRPAAKPPIVVPVGLRPT